MGRSSADRLLHTKRLRTHVEDLTHPMVFCTAAPFTMLGRGCPHPSFHDSYSVAKHPIRNSPFTSDGDAHKACAIDPESLYLQDDWDALPRPCPLAGLYLFCPFFLALAR